MLNRPKTIERIKAGERFTYLCFWGHAVPKASSTGKTCFSQWYSSAFEVEGDLYPTTEHWMMASKAKILGDDKMLVQILEDLDPHTAKAFIRKMHNFDNKVWKSIARRLVAKGNIHKYPQNEELRLFLKSTGNAVPVEASPRDCIWGLGLGKDIPRSINPPNWRE